MRDKHVVLINIGRQTGSPYWVDKQVSLFGGNIQLALIHTALFEGQMGSPLGVGDKWVSFFKGQTGM